MNSVPPGAAPDPDAAARRRRDRRVLLIALAAVIPFLLLVVGGIAGLVFYFLKGSEAYRLAETLIRQSPEIRTVVGEGLEFGWFPTGSIETSGPSGRAELTIRVVGTTGSARVHVRMRKQMGEWRVLEAVYESPEGVLHPLPLKKGVRDPGGPREAAA